MPTAPALGLAPAPASAPKESEATRKARTSPSSSNASVGRQLSGTGAWGSTGQLPNVAASGAGASAAQLPKPLPVPGAGMQTLASVKTAAGFDKLDDMFRAAVLRSGKARTSGYRSADELMGRAAPKVVPVQPRRPAADDDLFDLPASPAGFRPSAPVQAPTPAATATPDPYDFF